MAQITGAQIEKLIRKNFSSQDYKNYRMYAAGRIPPMSIIRLSNQFPSLNLAKEDILLTYDVDAGLINQGFLLTNHNLHFYKGYLEIQKLSTIFDNNGVLKLPLPDLADEAKTKLTKLFKAIAAYDPKEDTNVAIFRSSHKNKKRTSSPTVQAQAGLSVEQAIEQDLIDSNFLNMLQHEGDVYIDICKALDKDKGFKHTVQNMTNDSDIIVNDPSAKEFFAADLVKVFNLICDADGTTTRREKFALAYIAQRLLDGGDMADSIKLSRINDLIQNDNFHNNVARIRELKIKVKSEFPDELVLPVILSKLKHDLAQEVGNHIFRFANIVLKADGKVTEEEKAVLQKMKKMAFEPQKALANVKQIETPEDESLDDVIAELNELVGLRKIKEDIKTLINYLKIQKVREEKGLAPMKKSLHAVFMGPPGTGKTTIARLLSRIYKHLGILQKGQLVETDRAGLVAGYIGQTALKVDEVVKAALDGVLFIDEAYALSRGGDGRDFGNEAVEALLKRMEDYRNRLVIIVAGYPDEMETFINSNPGLHSRFDRYFTFDHYKPEELLAIFKLFAHKADFALSEDAEEKLQFIFEELYEKRSSTFGNARVARNIFGQCIERQVNRIVNIAPLTKEILMMLTEDDVPPVNETVQKVLVFDRTQSEKKQQEQQPQISPEQLQQMQQMMQGEEEKGDVKK